MTDNVSPKNCQPQNHPARQTYVCECGSGADVWDDWGVYCAKCYLEKQKAIVKKNLTGGAVSVQLPVYFADKENIS